jgi:hypothetical protein
VEKTPIRLQLAPRDRFDWRLNLMVIVGAFIATVLFQLLLFAFFPPLALLLSAVALFWGPWKLLRITLMRLDATEDGVYAVRPLGRGKLIPWDEIESIEEIDRETYLKEGLRCLWTNNLAPPSGTFTGLFRIRLKNGQYWLVPPSDRALFERKVLWKREQSKPIPRYYAKVEPAVEETPATLGNRWWQ